MKTTHHLGNFKWNYKLLVVFLLLALFMSSCDEDEAPVISDAGPQAWVEYPFDGETLPMGPVTLVAYAADSAGVSAINVKVNGVSLPAGQLSDLTSDGSNNLVRTDLVWQPPVKGEYIVEADGGGASSSITFCVVSCQPEEEIEIPPSPTASSTLPMITLPPAVPTDTPTPTPYTESQVEFWATPPYVNQGECTTLNWNVSGDFQAVYFEGSVVNASGSQQDCPAENRNYQLQVVEVDNVATDHWVTVEVYEVAAPPTDTLTPTEAPPPADTSGPTIHWTNLTFESCQFYGQASISDESGVASAQFHFNKNAEGWGSIWMQEISSELWESEVGISVDDGIGTPVGTVEFYMLASDSLGNQSESSITIYNYVSCDG